MMEGAVNDKDVISSITPGALALSGILLVFLGFAIRELGQLLDSARQEEFATRILVLRATIAVAVAMFVLGTVTAALGTGWLLGADVYEAVVVMFFVTLGVSILLAAGILWQGLT